jgi:hypothetical protein
MTRHAPTVPLPRTICGEIVGREQRTQFHALPFIGHLLRGLSRRGTRKLRPLEFRQHGNCRPSDDVRKSEPGMLADLSELLEFSL